MSFPGVVIRMLCPDFGSSVPQHRVRTGLVAGFLRGLGCGALLSLVGATRIIVPDVGSRSGVGVTRSTPDTVVSAVEIRNTAVRAFKTAFTYFVWDGGLLSDELRGPLNGLTADDLPATMQPPGWWSYTARDLSRRLSSKDDRRLSERTDPADTTPDDDGQNWIQATHVAGFVEHVREAELDEGYVRLQGARAYLRTAIDTLATMASANRAGVNTWRSELYALDGYTEIMLADLFCSGVPLNSVKHVPLTWLHILPIRKIPAGDIEKDYYLQVLGVRNLAYPNAITQHQVEFRQSATTHHVYQDALAKFDTALALAGDSARVMNLARIGRGRVWLALGQYDSAAAAVVQVPRGFRSRLVAWLNVDPDGDEEVATVADREGRNGFPYISSGDPRTTVNWAPTDKVIRQVQMPAKFWQDCRRWNTTAWCDPQQRMASQTSAGLIPFTLASWEEAILIRAEAALHRPHLAPGDTTWLQWLNLLRATAPIPGMTQPDPAKLPPLTDPGNDHARIALLFAERAAWLFLTGHRQGDLRRLVRVYGWPQDQVYPTGPYVVPKGFVGQVGTYGTDITMPIPPLERANPYFHGCLDRGA